MTMDNIEETCIHLHESFLIHRTKWLEYSWFRKTLTSNDFYQAVFRLTPVKSGLLSREALLLKEKERTKDHWMSPRIFCRAMMDCYPELLDDFDLFKHYISNLLVTTIEITSHQNNIVKFKNKNNEETIKIKYLTIDKYEKCVDKNGQEGIIFYNDGEGICKDHLYDYSTEFAFKNLVPDWITEFERKHLI